MANQDIKFSPFQPQNYELPHLYPYRMERSIISCGQDFFILPMFHFILPIATAAILQSAAHLGYLIHETL